MPEPVRDQKFHRDDLVRIADDLGPAMSHFTAAVDAVVVGSYADCFGGEGRHCYTLDLEEGGESSWYDESQLTLIEHGRGDLRQSWKAARDVVAKQSGDLDWIFANGEEVLDSTHGATVSALGDCLGAGNLWGADGEGVTYYQNALSILSHAAPYLVAGDKGGWLDYVSALRASETAVGGE